MPQVGTSFTSMNYARRVFIHEEVSRVLSAHPGLRAVPESVPGKHSRHRRRKVVISLEGHIPTMQGGLVCDVPVLVRLAPDHPESAPECFVEGRSCDELERVHIPYLTNWQHKPSCARTLSVGHLRMRSMVLQI
ncbi:ubiquitin-conjugating enzyme E2 variant 3-like [Branchiostoma floridae]|uniref:Ubiquitin-conjugating enzyme E2 variant 3-like n=1 Tax=Branchiostoma floridae TaxID=7739 RepID=A0A9J7HPD4_BRAFL|nr:ubiquitin-conjugating enzyme E2 variant 3-like [Branchiostoma floridae]